MQTKIVFHLNEVLLIIFCNSLWNILILHSFLSMLILHMFAIPSMLIWLKILILNDNVTTSKCKQIITEAA